MAYGTFKTAAEVAEKFDLKVARKSAFVNTKPLEIENILFSMIEDNLRNKVNYISEFAICETIIRPVLDIVAKKNFPLEVWSHVPYNVDSEKGLIGEPDYLVAKRNDYGAMVRPALCVIEAKKENFDEGWTQALAEMVASSVLGATCCYGIVTTGAVWQFGKLENNVFTVDPDDVSALRELHYVFEVINWMFAEIM